VRPSTASSTTWCPPRPRPLLRPRPEALKLVNTATETAPPTPWVSLTPGGLTAGYQAPATLDPLLATIAQDALDLLTDANRRYDTDDCRKIFLDTAPR
jgi:predicted RNA-binding Zn ribbon-like protein